MDSPHPNQEFQLILARLLQAAGLGATSWDIQVVHAPMTSPSIKVGNQINIPSGILLRVDNENEMAAILSRELAHIVADHRSERQGYRGLGALMLPPFLPVIRETSKVSDQFELVRGTIRTKTTASDGLNLFSQREQEVDYIGMLLMS
ncbi:MAG: hypothetical protein Q9180_004431 [Flavoplaca navasiana]